MKTSRCNRNVLSKYTVNCTLNKTVDKDVQSMLLPLNLMQYFMFCPKYRIKNDLITPNGLLSNFVSMIVTLIFMFLIILCTYLMLLNKDNLDYPAYSYVTAIYDCIFYIIGFTLQFVISIIQTKKHVHFVLTFQKVHRYLKAKTNFNHFTTWNWILGIIGLGFYVVIYTYLIWKLNATFYSTYLGYLLVVFDFNIIYAARVIQMLKKKIESWNFQVLNSRELQNTYGDQHSKKMFHTYVHILECYDIYKTCFQQFTLYHIIEIAIHCLSYTQVTIEASKKGMLVNNMEETIFRIWSVLGWLVKDFMWQSMLVQECEKFYLAIQSVQDTCALVQKTNCSDDEKKQCKNVLRLNRATFCKLRACGLFYVDAASQLSLMCFLTNYVVVLLQFAFL